MNIADRIAEVADAVELPFHLTEALMAEIAKKTMNRCNGESVGYIFANSPLDDFVKPIRHIAKALREVGLA